MYCGIERFFKKLNGVKIITDTRSRIRRHNKNLKLYKLRSFNTNTYILFFYISFGINFWEEELML